MKNLAAFVVFVSAAFFYHSASGQSATISGDILVNNNEQSIRDGGNVITVTLTGETWAAGMGDDNAVTTALINSFSGSASGSWNLVTAALDYTMVALDNDSIVSITLPAVTAYEIFADDTVSLNIDAVALTLLTTNLAATNDFIILHDAVTIVLSGTVNDGTDDNESDIRGGLSTIVLQIANDIWSTDLGLDDNASTTGLLDGITGDSSWDSVRAVLSSANVDRLSDTEAQISIPVVERYFIPADENVSILVPAVSFENYPEDVSSTGFQILNLPTLASLSGSIQDGSSNTELDIQNGGSTILIDLAGDLWDAQIGSDLVLTQVLLDGISNLSGTEWDNAVQAALSPANLIKNSDTQVTITLPAVPGYSIGTAETLRAIIPVSTLRATAADVTATPDLSIVPNEASVALGGNIFSGINNTDFDIRAGGSTITLTLSEDNWVAGLGEANATTEALVNGITGSAIWNSNVIPAILGADQGAGSVDVSANVVTITIPSVPSYDIDTDDLITINIPASCLEFSSASLTAGNLSILNTTAQALLSGPALNENNLEGAVLNLNLSDETFSTTTPQISDFTVNGTTAVSVSAVNYISSSQVNLVLASEGDIDTDISFSITISDGVLTGTSSLTSNSVTVIASVEPEILDISIPAGAYGIGDQVRVDIFVNDDQGTAYSYFSGTVAGKSFESFERQTNTLYYGFFTVVEGDQDYPADADIPVENLRLDQGALTGEVYNGSIVQGDDIIDAQRPVINYMQAPGGLKGIGDNVDIIISADGDSYIAVNSLTSANGISLSEPNISFLNLGNGVYILRYVVEEGDPDVPSGGLTAQLVLEDAAGNQSIPATNLTSNTVIIDANPPLVTSVSVDDGTYSIGDVVDVNVVADGSGYTASNESYINGVPLSSSYVTFTDLGGNNYLFQYTIRASHQEVNPGELEVNIILRDPAGNVGASYTTVEPNGLAIYTQLPTATLVGNQQICEDDSAMLIVNLTGRGPWSFSLNDGSTTVMYNDVNQTSYELYVKPGLSTSYFIESVTDVNGISNTGTGTVLITVNPKTDVEILNLNTSYSVEDDPVPLQANVSGGTFSGPGVVSANNIFSPELADTVNSPHTILYTYTNASGCVSKDSALVFVLGAEGDIYIPKEVFCDYDDPFEVTATNSAGSTGSFTLLDAAESEVAGLTDNNDNTASVDPALLLPGTYTVLYEYVQDAATLFIRAPFSVETVQAPKFITLSKSAYCLNEPAFSLEGDIETAVFAGPGVSGNVTDGFIFDPSSAYIGNNVITYTNTSVNGCSSVASKTVRINYVPNVNFSVSDVCMSPDDSIVFTNTTINKYTISEWYWNFGDINSGAENISNNESDYHFFTKSGSRKILLVGRTSAGCVDSLERVIDFGDKPKGSFDWTSDCFIEGDSIRFVYDPGDVQVSDYTWRFYTSASNYVEKTGSSDMYFAFSDTSEYRVDLLAETNIGCSTTFTRYISLKPTITIGEEPYYEDFSDGKGKWSAEQESASLYNGWKYGTVAFSGLGGGASRGWYTDIPDNGIYEQSYMISPCFNLRNLERPMITLDYLQSLDANREGAVLQTSVDHGQTWQNVGNLEDGINWFNSYQISNKPGGQDIGWTGEQPFNPDENWVEARHHLNPELTNTDNVRFRIAFASAHDSKEAREGFAFDNVWIGDRTRKVLLEHFTNVNDPDALQFDFQVNTIFRNYFDDLIKLEYHTEFPGADPLNAHNRAVPATRALFYGISNVPYSVMDGGGNGSMRFDYVLSDLKPVDVLLQSLNDPLFDIDISTEQDQNHIDVQVKITARDTLPPQERILQIAIFERIISGISTPNGEDNFINVVKSMLPNAAGSAIFDAWSEGDSRTFNFSWTYSNVYDPDMIRVAAFVQNDITKEVYQSASNDTTHVLTSRRTSEITKTSLLIYPNPASSELNLYMSDAENESFRIAFYDQLGRMVLEDKWDSYDRLKTMDVTFLDKGIYYIRIMDRKGGIRNTQKVVIFKR